MFCLYLYIFGCICLMVYVWFLCGCVREACLHHNKFLDPLLLSVSDCFHLQDGNLHCKMNFGPNQCSVLSEKSLHKVSEKVLTNGTILSLTVKPEIRMQLDLVSLCGMCGNV